MYIYVIYIIYVYICLYCNYLVLQEKITNMCLGKFLLRSPIKSCSKGFRQRLPNLCLGLVPHMYSAGFLDVQGQTIYPHSCLFECAVTYFQCSRGGAHAPEHAERSSHLDHNGEGTACTHLLCLGY